MSQQPKKQSASMARVSVSNPAQVATWCRRLRCSEQQLRAAVYVVGSNAVPLRAYVRAHLPV
jgi:Protein of unknown function (DUF3606)